MARREKPTSREILNISSELNQIAKGSEKLIASFERAISAGDKLPRSLAKSFNKARQQLLKDTKKHQTELQRLLKTTTESNEEVKKQIKIEERLIRQNKLKLDTMDRINDSYKTQNTRVSNLSLRITNLVSTTWILNKAWQITTKIFDTWVSLQEKQVRAMGTLQMKTGATTNQFMQMRDVIQDLRGTFGQLEGDVDGWEATSAFVGDLQIALRRTDLITRDFARSSLALTRGFGIGAEQASHLFYTIRNGATGAATSFDDFGANMLRFAEQIGANAASLVQDFVDARASVAQFGRTGQDTFRRSALMANHFGLETKKIFDMMKGFDTFDNASNNVNQLNAMMGTTISSFDMMMEQDPTRRLEMLRSQIMGVGLTWDRMSRMQRMSVAQTLGVEEDIAARLFQENITFSDLERERQIAAERQQRNSELQQSNTEMMNRLLMRTTTVFDSISRNFERFWNLLAEYFSPIIEEIYGQVNNLVKRFNDWLRSTTGQREMKKFMTDARNLIKDAFKWIERHLPTWEQFKVKVKEFWQEAKKIGEVIMPVLEWMWEHKELIAIIFAASKLAPFISGLSQIAGMLGPGGAVGSAAAGLTSVLAGAAIPLAAIGGSYALGEMAEGRRVEEGRRARTGDANTLTSLGGSALEELRRRRDMSDVNSAMRGEGGNSYLTNLGEGLGVLSGQEADLRRNNIISAIRRAAENPEFSSARAVREIRTSLGTELSRRVEQDQGRSIEQIVRDVRSRSDYFNRFEQNRAGAQAASATQTAPSTTQTVQAPISPSTNTPQDINITSTIVLDDGTIAGRTVQRAVSGR